MVLNHTKAMTKIDLKEILELKWPENVDFSNISKYPMTGFKERAPPGGTFFSENGHSDIWHIIPFFGSKFYVEFISGIKNATRRLLLEIQFSHTFLPIFPIQHLSAFSIVSLLKKINLRRYSILALKNYILSLIIILATPKYTFLRAYCIYGRD